MRHTPGCHRISIPVPIACCSPPLFFLPAQSVAGNSGPPFSVSPCTRTPYTCMYLPLNCDDLPPRLAGKFAFRAEAAFGAAPGAAVVVARRAEWVVADPGACPLRAAAEFFFFGSAFGFLAGSLLVTSVAARSFRKQPQLFACPFRRYLPSLLQTVPHLHRQIQCAVSPFCWYPAR